MSRIRKAYETRFRHLLQQARARRLEEGLQRMLRRAQALSSKDGTSLAEALSHLDRRLTAALRRRGSAPQPAPARFFCDAGLGGLARWLRAAGWEALWQPAIDDDALIRAARQHQAVILTTDSMLMERRLLRDRIIPAFWLSPALGVADQLAQVFHEFGLVRGQPRCMACGGELRPVEKEALRDRIPPRTYRWLDEYFVCARCGKLYWHGTHWARIQRELGRMTGS